MMHTRKRSIDQASEAASVVEPSQLLLLTPQSQASPSPVPSTPQPSSSHKKQRTRRNAKTEEEKQARADERALRNRRAAQESRDRRKKQLEHLETDNERLRAENDSLRNRLEILESQVNGMAQELEQYPKREVEEIVPTHYPAVVMSLDPQCQTISSPPLRQMPTTPPSSTSTSTLSLRSKRSHNQMLNQSNPSNSQTICLSLTNLPFCLRQWMISSLRISCPTACIDFCATFESLNTGSLDIGAGLKCNSVSGCESVSDGYSVEMDGVVFRHWVMEVMKVQESCVSLGSMLIDGNFIPVQQLNSDLNCSVISVEL